MRIFSMKTVVNSSQVTKCKQFSLEKKGGGHTLSQSSLFRSCQRFQAQLSLFFCKLLQVHLLYVASLQTREKRGAGVRFKLKSIFTILRVPHRVYKVKSSGQGDIWGQGLATTQGRKHDSSELQCGQKTLRICLEFTFRPRTALN